MVLPQGRRRATPRRASHAKAARIPHAATSRHRRTRSREPGLLPTPAPMPRHITAPIRIPVPGGKLIEEHVGRVNTQTESLSVAHMVAPPGWAEPSQTPAFDEVTIVLRGTMRVEHDGGQVDVGPGETVLCAAGERVRYSNPSIADECEYWAVCAPAFSPEAAGRDA